MPKDGLPPPSKSWGQNYLKNKGVIARIVDALELTAQDRVVEIGAGRGALTERILELHDGPYTGIEPHPPSFDYLMERFGERRHFSLIKHDAARVNYKELDATVAVGNLPYNAAAAILTALLASGREQRRWVLMFQKEMAQRIVAPHNNKTYGSLSVVTQALSTAKLLFHVSPGSFFPAPKVTSSVVLFTPKEGNDFMASGEAKHLLTTLFASRRKTLRKGLMKIMSGDKIVPLLNDLSISPTLRPENLSPDQFTLLILRVLQYKRM